MTKSTWSEWGQGSKVLWVTISLGIFPARIGSVSENGFVIIAHFVSSVRYPNNYPLFLPSFTDMGVLLITEPKILEWVSCSCQDIIVPLYWQNNTKSNVNILLSNNLRSLLKRENSQSTLTGTSLCPLVFPKQKDSRGQKTLEALSLSRHDRDCIWQIELLRGGFPIICQQ